MNILAHLPFIGTTGYANHARSFFCALNKLHKIRVRNFTVGKSWSGLNDTPHDGEDYLTDEMRDMLFLQTLFNNDGTRSDFPIYNYDPTFKPDVNIILMETNHHYFYDKYEGYNIAYNVYESTRYPEEFFNRLFYFDEVWVPTEWQYNCLVEQGYPSERISIVPEGVDIETFKPLERIPKKDKFRFLHFGRWDYRKSTSEILKVFSETFKNHNDVEMICSVENPFPSDGFNSTEERIKHFGIDTTNLVFTKFPPRDEYVKYLQEGDVFVSCARSEGWNLPLIEAMSCGVPSIYSNWGGQLQFAKDKGIPVKISHLRQANITSTLVEGEYCEPDFDDLSLKLKDAYENFKYHKSVAKKHARDIHENFTWEKMAQTAHEILTKINFQKLKTLEPKKINYNFIDGAYLSLFDNSERKFEVQFIDLKDNTIKYNSTIEDGWWAKPSIKYFVNWKIIVKTDGFYWEHKLNLTNKKVLISFESKSLGDNIAWIPYVEEFRTKHKCQVVCSTFYNNLFKEQYEEIEFVEPGTTVNELYALYRLGVFLKDGKIDMDKNPSDYRKVSLGKVASDILGIEYTEIKPRLPKLGKKKYKRVCIGVHSTAQAKYWNNPRGWQEVVDYLNVQGYEVRLLSREEDGYMGNQNPKGVVNQPESTIEKVLETIQESELFIGIGSGLSWLAWGAEVPVILISGFSDDYTEMKQDIIRIINKKVCNSCWNTEVFDAGDWNWCPYFKGTNRQFECSKKISSETVIDAIKKYL